MKKQNIKNRIKLCVPVFSIIILFLAVCGCNTKAGDDSNDIIVRDSLATAKGQVACDSENNYFEVLTLEEAIMSAYTDFGIAQSPYIDYQRSIKRYGLDAILLLWSQQWRFISVDNYRRFLSDTAECNKGEESLKTFISRIVIDELFFKSRITMDSYDMAEFKKAEIPSFKFYYKINPVMCRGNICGTKVDINSWKELDKNSATFILSRNGGIEDAYTFTRKNGYWYLTEYSPYDERNLMESY